MVIFLHVIRVLLNRQKRVILQIKQFNKLKFIKEYKKCI